jgi:hypothetical protein
VLQRNFASQQWGMFEGGLHRTFSSVSRSPPWQTSMMRYTCPSVSKAPSKAIELGQPSSARSVSISRRSRLSSFCRLILPQHDRWHVTNGTRGPVAAAGAKLHCHCICVIGLVSE